MELPGGPHIVLEGGLKEMVEADAFEEEDDSDGPAPDRLERLLLTEVRMGSAWAVALVLSLKFDDIQCTHDTVDNSSGSKLIHLAASCGDEAMVRLLLRTGAAVEEKDEHLRPVVQTQLKQTG
jgi:hypothetical protein